MHFHVFRLNTRKYGPEKTPYLDTFKAMIISRLFYKTFIIYLTKVSSRCLTKITFRFVIKTLFGHLQNALPRCISCLSKTSLRNFVDVFLQTWYRHHHHLHQKLMKELFTNKHRITLNLFSVKSFVVFNKHKVYNKLYLNY